MLNKFSNTDKQFKDDYSTTISVDNENVNILIKGANFIKIANENILLDKEYINLMLKDLKSTIESNISTHNPIPKTIIISYEDMSIICSDEIAATSAQCSKSANESNPTPLTDSEPKINSEPKIDSKTETNSDADTDSESPKPEADDSEDYIKHYKPRFTMDDVFCDPESKQQILSTLAIAKHRDKLYNKWGLASKLKSGRSVVLNFYGPPGTGKSMMAEGIASFLDKDVYSVNYSELESNSVGETPKKITKIFEKAKEANAVLIFDEADSFLSKRLTNVTQAADYSVNLTRSVLLIEVERFDGVVIFTTNFLANYDVAFKRRILASVEFKLPDEKGREQIWVSHLPATLPLDPGINPQTLAEKYGGICGADVKDIVLIAAVSCIQDNRESLSWDDFDVAYKNVKSRYSVI